MTPEEHTKQEADRQKLGTARLQEQVAMGGCPKCGSLLHGPDADGVRLCRNCGNKFEVKKEEKP